VPDPDLRVSTGFSEHAAYGDPAAAALPRLLHDFRVIEAFQPRDPARALDERGVAIFRVGERYPGISVGQGDSAYPIGEFYVQLVAGGAKAFETHGGVILCDKRSAVKMRKTANEFRYPRTSS